MPFVAVAALVLVLGTAIRLWTATNLALFPTEDSWDYVVIAEDLRAGHWDSPRLGDFRLPGYPIFLAGLREAFGTGAFALLLAQAILGLATALAVARSVFLLAGASAAIPSGALIALHPVFLLFEHQVMTESLFVATLALVIWLAATILRRGFRPALGVALGLAAGANLLTRANAVLALGVLAVALGWLALRSGGVAEPRARAPRRRFWRFAFGGLAGCAALLLPWLAFMESRFGERALLRSQSRNRLVYLALHRILDPSLPGFAPYRGLYAPASPGTVYELLWTLTSRGEAGEEAARALVREQLEAHPGRVAMACFETVAEFVGIRRPRAEDLGRRDVHYWFVTILPDRDSLAPLVERFAPFFETYFPDGNRLLDRHGSGLWSAAGELYLSAVRHFLILGALLLGGLAWRGGRRRSAAGEGSPRRRMIGLLTLALLATIGLHAVMLASLDRFAVSFDALAMVLLALALVELATRGPLMSPKCDYRPLST